MSWQQSTIDEACLLVTDGTHYTPPDVGQGIPFLTVKDCSNDGHIDLIGCSHITGDEFAKAEKGNSAPKRGDVLFSKDGTVGKVYVVDTRETFAVLSSLAILRPDASRLDASYFGWVLKTDSCLDQASQSKTGSAIRRIILKDLRRVRFPLPPLDKQKRIAAILDAADALRAKRREALAQLDTLLQSTFLDMFGDPVVNPMEWEERHLPDLVSKRKHALKRGPFGGALKKEIFVPEGFKVYEQKNVIYDDFDIGSYFIKKSDYERLVPFKVSSNNLLISCSGTIGSIAAAPVDAAPGVMNQALLKIDLDESIMLNSFFLSLWRSQSFEDQVLGMTHGTGMKNMKSMNELKGINFIVPPIDLQHRFAAIDQSVEKQRARQRAHLAELDTLFASLQSRAFRGDL